MTQSEKKNCRVGLATDDDMAHAHFMLNTQGYKHAPRICKTHCFSTATMVTETRLNVTLPVLCVSCVYIHIP